MHISYLCAKTVIFCEVIIRVIIFGGNYEKENSSNDSFSNNCDLMFMPKWTLLL